MKRKLTRVFLTAVAALLFAGAPALAQSSTAEGRFERTLEVSGAVELSVSTGSGNITVRPGDASKVKVLGVIKARDSRWGGLSAAEKVRQIESHPPIEQTGSSIVIGRIEDRELRENVSISYEILTPAATRLRANSGSGNVLAEGLSGQAEAGTGSGNISLASLTGDVRAQTGSGDVDLRGLKGAVKASTGSGSIKALGIAGAFKGSTGSGNIEVEQSAAGDVEVNTGSGRIGARGLTGGLRVTTGSGSILAEGRPGSGWRVRTSSGNITLRLPADAAFELAARTSSGTIHTVHPVTVQGTIGRREIRGVVRGGGALLEVSTSSGDIRIE
jgi:DUF4097 and DUF4098 domain-containing protein YvlB